MSSTSSTIQRQTAEIPVAESRQLILAEAMKIVRGETMMLATKAHLKALARVIREAKSHLDVALLQALPSDDQIIVGHIKDASDLLGGAQ